MVTPELKAHFDTMGFLFLRQLFSANEVAAITETAEGAWREARGGTPFKGEAQWLTHSFVETRPLLTDVVEDDRIYLTIEGLLGPGFVWTGSEGRVTAETEQGWHADRPGEKELDYTRLKTMIYLDPTSKEKGALRVLPGSHRLPLHRELLPLNSQQKDQTRTPFGVPGRELPGFPVESKPGDVLFFNQCLFHAVFAGWPGRRYIALKFAQKPETDEHILRLVEKSRTIFEPHEAWVSSDRPRIRAMVDPLVDAAANRLPRMG